MSKFKLLGQFVSKADEALEALARQKGTGAEFLRELEKTPGVKAQEIKDRGLDKALPAMGKTTKVEVKKVLEQNPPPKIEEKVLGGSQPYDAKRLSELEAEYKKLKQHPVDDPSFGQEKYDELIRLMNIRDQSTTESLYEKANRAIRLGQQAQKRGNKSDAEKYFREHEFLNTRAEKLELQGLGLENPTKYGQYQIPGGQNYREILLKLPTKAVDKNDWRTANREQLLESLRLYRTYFDEKDIDLVDTESLRGIVRELQETPESRRSVGDFRSPHWDEPNVLAHARVSDRVGPNGEKILHIEEIQSDWHQAGRKKGYKTGKEKQQMAELYKQYDDLAAKRRELIKQSDEMFGRGAEFTSVINEINSITPKLMRLQTQMDAVHSAEQSGVMDAPFKKDWHELTMKRLLNYAAENGYDRLAITPGAKQAERYDLSKQVNSISYHPDDQGRGMFLNVFDKNNNVVYSKLTPEDKIEEVIGKEAASKLLQQAPVDNGRVLTGLDLQIGGEGMKGFYDKMLPNYLNSLGKPYGAQVGTFDVKGVPLHSFDITPQMRQDISQKGLPLYQQIGIPTGAVGAGAAQPEQEQKKGGKVHFSDDLNMMRLELSGGGMVGKAAAEAMAKLRLLREEAAAVAAQQARYAEEMKNVNTKDMPTFEQWRAQQPVEKAEGGEVTIPDMTDGGKIIDGGPFKKGGKVQFTNNLDAMRLALGK